jgi:antitoxin CptB
MDDRRKKLKFRAWRRGFREFDLILGPFADERLPGMSETELDQFEALLKAADQDVYSWVLGQPAPTEYETELLDAIRTYRAAMGPNPSRTT